MPRSPSIRTAESSTGRNRLAACEMVGVEPAFVTYDGADPDAFAYSVNSARRHLLKGQLAVIAVRAVDCSTRTILDGNSGRPR